jgi:hypothetical protein
MSFNPNAEAYEPSNGAAKDPGKPPPDVAKPAKVKAKPAAAELPKSLSAMNLAMTPDEEAIAQRVETALSAECGSSERNAAAGGAAHAIKDRAHPDAQDALLHCSARREVVSGGTSSDACVPDLSHLATDAPAGGEACVPVLQTSWRCAART